MRAVPVAARADGDVDGLVILGQPEPVETEPVADRGASLRLALIVHIYLRPSTLIRRGGT